jgi:hypothetical protein
LNALTDKRISTTDERCCALSHIKVVIPRGFTRFSNRHTYVSGQSLSAHLYRAASLIPSSLPRGFFMRLGLTRLSIRQRLVNNGFNDPVSCFFNLIGFQPKNIAHHYVRFDAINHCKRLNEFFILHFSDLHL